MIQWQSSEHSHRNAGYREKSKQHGLSVWTNFAFKIVAFLDVGLPNCNDLSPLTCRATRPKLKVFFIDDNGNPFLYYQNIYETIHDRLDSTMDPEALKSEKLL
jgi:hypothetical protein